MPDENTMQADTMDQKELDEILDKHKKWLAGKPGGERAYLSGCDLRHSDLSGCDLRHSDLSGCDLSGSNLSGSNLSGCNLSGCNLRHSDLSDCDLSGSNLSGCDLSDCDLSGSNGLISPIQYMTENFDKSPDGYIAYKTFNIEYSAPSKWGIAPGAVIEETVNANRTDTCGCGINVAPLDWVKQRYKTGIWKVLIRWEWLPGVCVPYNTDGKIRCERVELIEIVQ